LGLIIAAVQIAGGVESLGQQGNTPSGREYTRPLSDNQIEAEGPIPEIDYDFAGVLHKQEKYEEAIDATPRR